MAAPTCSQNVGGERPRPIFTSLPDELLQQILSFCPPGDLLHIQILSRRFHTLAGEPLLWRYHCRTAFKYWAGRHQIQQKFLQSVGDIDWKLLYIQRRRLDVQISGLLDSILGSQSNRISKFESISEFGYDAKDTLLQHCHTDDSVQDVLARRYYANAVLDHIHRAKALNVWERSVSGEAVPLEHALGAFDLFVLHDQTGDPAEISSILDGLASQFELEHPEFKDCSVRRTAVAVVIFLRRHNLTGIASEIAYRDLQNNYISIALQDRDHPSLPLISVAIFCALGQRLGLNTRCCAIPSHAHAMVLPPEGETLDGLQLAPGDPPAEAMYLDPYRSDEEVPLSNLRRMLVEWGVPEPQRIGALSDCSTADVVLRTSRNILATVREYRANATIGDTSGHPRITLHANPFADLDNSFYSTLWAHFIFASPAQRAGRAPQGQFVPMIMERFERLYPMDASLIEKYLVPFYNNTGQGTLQDGLRIVRAADQTPKQVRRRNTPAGKDGVRYKVGQVFRHRRYAYTAAITGWDIECGMGSDWMAHNDVDSLRRGRNQSFYHAFTFSVEDASVRYVAEENIEIIEPEVPTSLMSLAGRYFNRWDKERHVFISNIRDEYPDD